MPEKAVHESRQSRSRQALATYFRRIARALGRGEPVPVDDAGTVTVDPAPEQEVEIELEREDGMVHFEIEMEWPETEGEINDDAAASKAAFELYTDSVDEWRWRLVHDNGNIIADGGGGYSDKRDAKSGIESVQRNAPGAHVIDISRRGGTRRRRERRHLRDIQGHGGRTPLAAPPRQRERHRRRRTGVRLQTESETGT